MKTMLWLMKLRIDYDQIQVCYKHTMNDYVNLKIIFLIKNTPNKNLLEQTSLYYSVGKNEMLHEKPSYVQVLTGIVL